MGVRLKLKSQKAISTRAVSWGYDEIAASASSDVSNSMKAKVIDSLRLRLTSTIVPKGANRACSYYSVV